MLIKNIKIKDVLVIKILYADNSWRHLSIYYITFGCMNNNDS